MEVKGHLEPKATAAEMQELFKDIDFLIDPVFDFGDLELETLREKIRILKKHLN